MSNLRYIQSRTLWIAIIIAFFLLVAFIIGNNVKNSTVTAAVTYNTTSVRRGDLEALVSATGRINPINEVSLSFQINGVISNVAVRQGDLVQQGQTLARIDSREVELNVSATQASFRQAQAKLEIIKSGPGKDLDTALANLKQAQTRLQVAKSSNAIIPEDVQAAQAELDLAQAKYNNLLNRPNPKDIQQAEATLRQAQAKLDQALNPPAPITAPLPPTTQGPTPAQLIAQAQSELDAAQQNLNKVTSSTNNSLKGSDDYRLV